MPTLEELLKSNNPEVETFLNEIRKKAKASDINKALSSGEGLSAAEIDEINKNADLISKPSKVSSSLEDFGPSAKDILRKERIDELFKNLQRSSDTPNISNKLDDLENLGRSSPYMSPYMNRGEIDELTKSSLLGDLGKYGDDLLAKFPSLAKAVNLAKPAAKYIPPIATGVEALSTIGNINKGNYEDAAVSGLGVGAGVAQMTGSALAVPAALMVGGLQGGKELGKIQKEYEDKYMKNFPRDEYGNVDAAATNMLPRELAPKFNKENESPPRDVSFDEVMDNSSKMPPELSKKQLLMQELEKLKNNPTDVKTTSKVTGSASSRGGSNNNDLSRALSEMEGFTNATVANQLMAQKLASDNQFAANFGKAMGLLGTGISGTVSKLGPPKDMSAELYESLLKTADQPVKTLEAATEQEKTDPNSTISVNFRKFIEPMAKAIKMVIPPNASAAQISSILPQAANMFNQKQAQDARALEASLRREDMASLRAEKQALKEERDVESFIERARNQLKPRRDEFGKIARANDIASSMDNENAIQQVSALYNLITSLDPTSVVRESEISLATSAGGLRGTLVKVFSQLTNNPQLISSKTVNDIKKEIARITQVQEKDYKTIRDSYLKQGKKVGVSEDRFGEIDPYYDLLKNKETPSGSQTPTVKKELRDIDKQALEWANKNPNDPRSKEIKKRLGQ